MASTPARGLRQRIHLHRPPNNLSYPYTLPAAGTAPTATELTNAAVGTGIGHQTITPTFTLAVPANAYVGTYTSTWTFTLASGP